MPDAVIRHYLFPNCPRCHRTVKEINIDSIRVKTSPDGIVIGGAFVPGQLTQEHVVGHEIVLRPCGDSFYDKDPLWQQWMRRYKEFKVSKKPDGWEWQ
jgi:hypothetical protein